MEGRRNLFVAREGIPFLLLCAVGFGLSMQFVNFVLAVISIMMAGVFYLVFRDPRRDITASPLGVVSPVDGVVVDIDLTDKGVMQGEAHVVRIRIDSLGTYTARAPVEGKIMDLQSINGDRVVDYRTNALCLQTDEGDDVLLQFHGYRFGFAPMSFVRFGERVGQGQRCAYLRLTRFAEVHLPIESKILVKPGQTIAAGSDLIGKLPHA